MIYTISLSGLIVLFLALIFIKWFNFNAMKKDTKNLLLGLAGFTGIALIIWLFSKENYKCPKCNYPLIRGLNPCPSCGQLIQWEKEK